MSNLFSLIKLEFESRTPFPVIEFFIFLFISFTFTRIVGFTGYSYTTNLETARVTFIDGSSIICAETLNYNLLYSGIFLSAFLGLSIAGDLDKGLVMNMLVLPIRRATYLGSKISFYGLLIFSATFFSYIFTMQFSSLQLSLLDNLLILATIASTTCFLVSIPLFIAVFSKKASTTIILSITITISMLLIFSTLSPPFLYFNKPYLVLETREYVDWLIGGIFTHLLCFLSLLTVSFYYFINMDIKGGEN